MGKHGACWNGSLSFRWPLQLLSVSLACDSRMRVGLRDERNKSKAATKEWVSCNRFICLQFFVLFVCYCWMNFVWISNELFDKETHVFTCSCDITITSVFWWRGAGEIVYIHSACTLSCRGAQLQGGGWGSLLLSAKVHHDEGRQWPFEIFHIRPHTQCE